MLRMKSGHLIWKTYMTSLASLRQNSIDIYRAMKEQLNEDYLAAPLVSVAPPDLHSKGRRSVLYLGQATRGDWGRGEFDADPGLDARRRFTQGFLACPDLGAQYGSNFWRFAYQLSAVVANSDSHVPYLGNLIWSNLGKIGVQNGNPRGEYLSAQTESAIHVLSAEIDEYHPGLIVFAAGSFGGAIIEGALATFVTIPWQKENEDDGYWWRPRTVDLPAILFTNHPGRAPRVDKEKWLACARQLLELT